MERKALMWQIIKNLSDCHETHLLAPIRASILHPREDRQTLQKHCLLSNNALLDRSLPVLGGGYSWAISTSIHHSFSPSCYKFEAITGAAGTKEIAPSFCRKSHLAWCSYWLHKTKWSDPIVLQHLLQPNWSDVGVRRMVRYDFLLAKCRVNEQNQFPPN